MRGGGIFSWPGGGVSLERNTCAASGSAAPTANCKAPSAGTGWPLPLSPGPGAGPTQTSSPPPTSSGSASCPATPCAP